MNLTTERILAESSRLAAEYADKRPKALALEQHAIEVRRFEAQAISANSSISPLRDIEAMKNINVDMS